ncbi:hypothetical protein [Gordonibacter sp. RACS_AR68]|uniref:hypothetical protein n=1 Tax=Gordonibacter sp. RACS_AR68 TaxID=2872005 RepID=UPI00260E7984|nr:hypothetical protein [Gordonibacter sp. RACS_AR68]MDN4470361.1 hypothetical protein [Gordonibacter sp. RACS_AR68]
MRRFTITFLVLQVLCLFAIIVLGWNGCTRDIPDLLMALCIPLITMSASLAILYRKCGLYLKQQRSSSRILVIISYFVVAIIACALLFFFSASWQTLNDPTNSPIGIVSIFLISVTIGLGVFLPQKRAESSKNLSSSYTQPQEQRWLNLFDDTPKSRAQLRKLILLDLAFFLVASASVLILAIVLVVINSKCLVFGPILMDFAIDMLFLAWLMAKVISASNKYFFKDVALSCTLQSQTDKFVLEPCSVEKYLREDAENRVHLMIYKGELPSCYSIMISEPSQEELKSENAVTLGFNDSKSRVVDN